MAFAVGATAGLIAVQFFQVHLFTLVVVLWVAVSMRSSERWVLWRAALVIAASIPLATTALTGDLVNSPTLALQLIALAVCAALIVVNADREDIKTMLYGLLVVATAASAWAMLQVVDIVPNDAWHLDVSALGRPTGFYPEPDWLGMFAGIGLVLAWRLELRPRWRVILVAVNGFALALAFARAAWVAVVASSLIAFALYVINLRRDRGRTVIAEVRTGRLAATGVLVAAGAIALASVPSLASDLILRLSRTLTVADNDISAQARVQQNDSLSFLASTAPWNGHGISSSGRVGVSGIIEYGESVNNVGSNWIVSMWVDGAWLSLPIVCILLLTAVFSARSIAGQLLLLVLLNSLFSNATYQPVTWLLLGICLASSNFDRKRPSDVGEKLTKPIVVRETLARHFPTSGTPLRTRT